MPEIRTNVTVELHRKLKGEAVNRGLYLKHLMALILEEYFKVTKTNKAHRTNSGKQK